MRPWRIPQEEIRFAAKTGFLSKPIWEAYFAKGCYSWRQKQWNALWERGLFLPHSSRLARDVLVPNSDHPIVKKLADRAPARPSIVSQIEHDETVARIVLELQRQGFLESYCFEPEMKAKELSQGRLPSKFNLVKYPDAVLTLRGPSKASKIALEIELSRKSPMRYRELLNAFQNRKEIGAVLFLARRKPIFDALRSAMRDIHYPNWERPIGFCDLDAWLINPSKAAIYFSDRVTTLEGMSTPGACSTAKIDTP